MKQLEDICNLNIKSLRGMLKILKPIKADEASAVRMMLAQVLQNDLEMRKIIKQKSNTSRSEAVDWESVTEDIE